MTESEASRQKVKEWCVNHSWLFHAVLACIAYFVGGMQYGPVAWLASSVLQLWKGNKNEMAAIFAFSGLILTACGL